MGKGQVDGDILAAAVRIVLEARGKVVLEAGIVLMHGPVGERHGVQLVPQIGQSMMVRRRIVRLQVSHRPARLVGEQLDRGGHVGVGLAQGEGREESVGRPSYPSAIAGEVGRRHAVERVRLVQEADVGFSGERVGDAISKSCAISL